MVIEKMVENLLTMLTKWVATYWQLKLVVIATSLLIMMIKISKETSIRSKLQKEYPMKRKALIQSSFIDSILSIYYAGDPLGKLYVLLQVVVHIFILLILIVHLPLVLTEAYVVFNRGVFTPEAYRFLTYYLGLSKNNIVVVSAIIAFVALMIMLIINFNEFRKINLKTLQTATVVLSGLSSRMLNYAILIHIHVILGFILIIYLIATNKGLHWFRALILLIVKYW